VELHEAIERIAKNELQDRVGDAAAGAMPRKPARTRAPDFSRTYWPFQFGVRLLRNASIPSRKSSLM
jgi:hypothetical protein